MQVKKNIIRKKTCGVASSLAKLTASPTSPHRRAMVRINDYGWKVRIKWGRVFSQPRLSGKLMLLYEPIEIQYTHLHILVHGVVALLQPEYEEYP